ncbi:MAG: Asp-tRNA(Asn)/Glu-tRNA(Gln) amidotransferase subunit GatB [Legionellales bacterium]|nr:Asp-tRNA(Asn)/Glu-tRNA(Gln) amidotransferase subunit GatB [Legionellales bacterium]
MEYEAVIGLEIHVQLNTQSKIFSGASTQYGAKPNHQACAIDLGLPGVLPVLNQEAVRKAIKLGLAIQGEIAKRCVFARKNYFYPDLPKGYQISQLELPIISHGKLPIYLDDGSAKIIHITRAHLEEDAGKSIHQVRPHKTGIDLNRAGTPLIEVVSEPELHSAKEAVAYMKALHALVCYLDICDGNLQEGSFRCDANVSVRPKGSSILGTRAEIKNINSFRFVEKAINYEIERQTDLIKHGSKVIQETRLYDSELNCTRSMREKEHANDYRYFPDPDLLPLIIDEKIIADIKKTMPELPEIKLQRYQCDYSLSQEDAGFLISNIHFANYFETILAINPTLPAKLIVNWLMGDMSYYLNKHQLEFTQLPFQPQQFADLLLRIHDDTISAKAAKIIFAELNTQQSIDAIIREKGLVQLNDSSELEKMIDEIIHQNPNQVAQYRGGKTKLLAFFVGQVMKLTKGNANPDTVNALLLKKLG